MKRLILVGVAALLAVGVVHAQSPRAAAPPSPEEKQSVTRNTVRVGGQAINYTATAATYVIKADDGTHRFPVHLNLVTHQLMLLE